MSVDDMTGSFPPAPASGLMGLAFKPLAAINATPFWQALIDDKQLNAPEMSFWLARDTDPASVAPGGVFTLGGTNSTLFSGDIEFLNLTSEPSFWALSLSSKYSA